MSLIFYPEDWHKLVQQTSQLQSKNLALDDFEKLWSVPEIVGTGFSREIKLSPGIELQFSECEYHQSFCLKIPTHDHPIQFMILLSGSYYSDIYPTFNKARSYFSGSGISPQYVEKFQAGQRIVSVNVEIATNILDSYWFPDNHSHANLREQLCKGKDWKLAFSPTVTSKMRLLAHQLWNAPYRGTAKQMYLQGKVFELLALHFDLMSVDQQPIDSSSKLKPKTIASLYHAKDILTQQSEHPPSLPQLAQKVGVSQRTLQRGFPSLFNTTVVGYIAQQRLDRAEMLLREGRYSVAEVALLVGYGNFGHFSVAFKNRFGITPSKCLAGKKADFEQT